MEVYAGEGRPRVELRWVREFARVQELVEHLQRVQDIYYVEFEACETITDNLRVYSPSQETFFLVEYDGARKSLHLWKSAGQWRVADLIGHVYSRAAHWTPDLECDARLQHYAHREWLQRAMPSLRFSADAWDADSFWRLLELQTAKLDWGQDSAELAFRTALAMVCVRLSLNHNKRKIATRLQDYYTSMSALCNNTIEEPGYTPVRVAPQPGSTKGLGDFPNNILISNFKSHFKHSADNFEAQLKTPSARPSQLNY